MAHYQIHRQVKFQTPKFLRVVEEKCLNKFSLFRGQMRRRADLKNCRRYQSAFCARLLGMGQRVQCGSKYFKNWVHFQEITPQM